MQLSDDQRRQLQEKLKNMSPEELKQLQKEQCVFCQIISGKIPGRTVFEDDQVKVVLDINPAAPGHCLLVPKEHVMVWPQAHDKLMRHVAAVAKKVSHAMLRALKADGVSWVLHNGAIAGQRAPHAIAHIIPRMDKDNIGIFLPQGNLDEAQAKSLMETLKAPSAAKQAAPAPTPLISKESLADENAQPLAKKEEPKPAPEPEAEDEESEEESELESKEEQAQEEPKGRAKSSEETHAQPSPSPEKRSKAGKPDLDELTRLLAGK